MNGRKSNKILPESIFKHFAFLLTLHKLARRCDIKRKKERNGGTFLKSRQTPQFKM